MAKTHAILSSYNQSTKGKKTMKQNKNNIVEKNQETTLEFSEQDFLEVKAMVAKSAYCLGRCYETGIGTDKNETEAVRLYNIAAEQGHDKASMALARCYKFGIGVKMDLSEAAKWLRVAAEHGFPNAMLLLGNFYATGTGIKRNDKEAFKWFGMAAERGVVEAMFELGHCYSNGIGVEVDKVKAFSWFCMGAGITEEELQNRHVIDNN